MQIDSSASRTAISPRFAIRILENRIYLAG